MWNLRLRGIAWEKSAWDVGGRQETSQGTISIMQWYSSNENRYRECAPPNGTLDMIFFRHHLPRRLSFSPDGSGQQRACLPCIVPDRGTASKANARKSGGAFAAGGEDACHGAEGPRDRPRVAR